jgi:hypothetical protein
VFPGCSRDVSSFVCLECRKSTHYLLNFEPSHARFRTNLSKCRNNEVECVVFPHLLNIKFFSYSTRLKSRTISFWTSKSIPKRHWIITIQLKNTAYTGEKKFYSGFTAIRTSLQRWRTRREVKRHRAIKGRHTWYTFSQDGIQEVTFFAPSGVTYSSQRRPDPITR